MPPAAAKPPLVRGLPLLGNTLDALRDVCALMTQAYHIHGPVFRLSRLGREAVVLAGLKANEFFLQNDSILFYSHDIYHHLSREGGTEYSFIALDGEPHQHLRHQMRLGYSRQMIADKVPGMVDYVQAQAQSWLPGQTLDVLEAMSNLLMEQAGTSLLSHSLAPHDYHAMNVFCKTFVGVGVDIQPPILLRRPSYQRSKKHFLAMMDTVFAEHTAHPPGDSRPLDQVDLARQATYAHGGKLSETDAKGCTYFSYVMNSVYTNRLCANLLYALLKDPGLMGRALAEVDAVCDAGPVDILALRHLPVLRAAMREALRLYPIVAGIPRHAKEDFEFGGYTIRKGEKVYIAGSVAHYLPEVFPNPYVFDADRFLPPREEHRQPRAFLPFGAGAHACLGASLATLFTLTTMVGVLRGTEFQIEPASYVAKRVADPMPGPSGFQVRVGRRTPPARGSAPQPQQSDEEVVLLDAPELDRSQQDQLAAHAVQRTYGPGETIIKQGDEADAFYILSHGHLNVFLEIPAQAPRLLGQLHDGAFFGEIGLLQGVRRTATVTVSEDAGAEVLAIDRATFMQYVAEFDLVGDEIAALVRRRTISLNLAKALPSLSPELLAQISPALEIRSFGPGEAIIRQGGESDAFYILTSGRAEVIQEHPDGRTMTLDWREPGEYFGEIGLMRNRPRTATVRAASDGADVLVIDRTSFFNLVGSSEVTEGAIARSMARRLIHMAGVD